MGAFDDYRNRLATQGGSLSQAYDNDTTNFINVTFTNSPTYTQVTVDGTQYDARVIRTDNPHMKKVMFRPATRIYEGGLVTLNEDTWLVQKFEPHPLYPVATILQCNESLRWYDSGRVLHTDPCVFISLHRMIALTQDVAMETIKYQMRVLTQKNPDTELIQISQRFILGSQAYIVVGVDNASYVYDGHGLLELSVEATPFLAGDDRTNKIADNTKLWTKNSGGADGGGTATW